MSEPDVVHFTEDDTLRQAALVAGKAIGPVSEVVWSVDLLDGETTLTFIDEAHARSHWNQHGGMLNRTETSSWVLAADWRERSGVAE